jgi:hypothetical protein
MRESEVQELEHIMKRVPCEVKVIIFALFFVWKLILHREAPIIRQEK